MASVELVQPVDTTWLMPCSSSAIDTSLEIMPTIDTGIAYGVTRFHPSVKNSPYCRSATSIPPAPLPTSTPASGSFRRSPASCHASLAAMTAISDAFEYRRGSARPVGPPLPSGARSSISSASSMLTGGTGAATVQGYGEASNSAIARVALQPRLICRQNRSRPMPKGDTTPIPVTATRGGR
jgi:hypothetical protein